MNLAVLIGRLTKDTELRSTTSGVSSVTFNLAVKQSFKTDGEYKADFFRCVAFRGSAEYLSAYGKKGDMISVKGHLHSSTWEKDGEKQYRTEVIAESVQILSSRKDTSSTAGGPPSPQGEGMMPEMPSEFGADVIDDDLPF